MFYYIVSDKNGEMYQRSYSVINRRRSLVDDKQLVKFINIVQPGTMLPNEMVLVPLQTLKIKYELSYQSTTRLNYIDKFDQLLIIHQ
jgi:hypothetical protein